jgi:drug/metabolite transporter (DMT)-like permease
LKAQSPDLKPAAPAVPWLVTLSLAVAVLGWGWAWVGIRDTVRFYEPGPLALGRYLVASAVLLPIWLWRGAKLPARGDWPLTLLLGLSGFTLYNYCINVGEQTVAAGTASLIAACIPVMVTLGARFFFAEKLTWIGWFGIGLSFAGVGTTTLGAGKAIQLSLGAVLVLAASVCAATYSLLNKRLLKRYAPLEVTTWTIWAGTLGLLPFGAGLPATVAAAPALATFKVALLGLVPGALCYALFSYAITKIPMARVASWMFLVSLTSVSLGWLLLDELPSGMALVGGGITLAGVYLVNTRGHPPA